MYTVKQVAIFAENKLGLLASVTKILADARINIRWVTIATRDSFGVIKLMVDKCDEAVKVLKDGGFTVSLIDVLAIQVEDKPGALHAIATTFAAHQINVENSSGFVTKTKAILIIEVPDMAHAQKVLIRQNLHLLTQAELLHI
jgi:hypothetical protein